MGMQDAALLAESVELFSAEFFRALLDLVVFGVVGIALVVLGFKVFDWVLPRIDLERELGERQNLPVAIVTAAVILGICYIVAHVVRGGG